MTGAALASELAPAAIPLIAARVVDDAIRTGDRGALLPLAGLALLLGVLEAVAVLVRRWVMSKAALGHGDRPAPRPLRAPAAAAGLLPRPLAVRPAAVPGHRATCPRSAGSSASGWSSWSSTRHRLRGGRRPAVLPVLAAGAAGRSRSPCRWWSSSAGSSVRYARVSRRAQDLNGELATIVEEAAAGIRHDQVVRPAAAGARPVPGRGPRAARRRSCGKVTVLAYFWVAARGLPAGRARAGGAAAAAIAVAQGALTLGELVAFVSLQLMLLWPIDSLGWLIAMAQEAETAAERIYEVLDTAADRRSTGPARGRCRPSPGGCGFEGVGFRYPGARPGRAARRRPGARARARRWRWSGATGSRQDHADRAGPAAARRDRAAGSLLDGARHPRPAAGAAARGGRRRVRGRRRCSRLSVRENLTLGRAGRHRRRGRARRCDVAQAELRPRPAVGPGHPGRRAGAVPVRRAAAAARAGPRGARPARGCWCSTTRCPRWTCTPRRWSSRRCAGCCAGTTALVVVHRPSTVAAGRPGRAARRTARSPRSARTRELLATRPRVPATCWPQESDARRTVRAVDRDRRTGAGRIDVDTVTRTGAGVAAERRRRARRTRRSAIRLRAPQPRGCSARLLRPHRRAARGVAASSLLLVQNAAAMAGP